MSTLPAGVDMDRNGANRWVAFDINNTISSPELGSMGELKIYQWLQHSFCNVVVNSNLSSHCVFKVSLEYLIARTGIQ